MTAGADRQRLVVLISGSGSNLQAIIDAARGGRLDADVVAVFSNRRAAFGLERARRAEISACYRPFGPYRAAGRPRADYDADLAAEIAALSPDLVVLAGWMMILSRAFIERVGCPVINLHPALPGAFPGKDAIPRALSARRRGEVTHTGVMVHHVVAEVDAGPVVAQAPVPIAEGDDLPTLTARIHRVEHSLLVDAIAALGRENLRSTS